MHAGFGGRGFSRGKVRKERRWKQADWRKSRVLQGEIMETDEGSGEEEECRGMKWSITPDLILLFM